MKTVHCPHCGKQIHETDNVCMYCGTRLRYRNAFCFRCGAPIDTDAAFCSNCGCSVGETNPAADRLPGTVVSAGGERTVQRQIMKNTELQQQETQQMADYRDQTETAKQVMDRQPERQQTAQQADYQQQVQNAHEAMEQPKQQTAQQAADYQQQVQNAHKAMNQSGQETAKQTAEYQHMSEIGKETVAQEAGGHISRSATAGARRAAKLGLETGKIAAKGAARSVGNMIGLKIAAVATAATIATGGATVGGVALVQHIVDSNSESNSAIVEEYEEPSIVIEEPPVETEPEAVPETPVPTEEIVQILPDGEYEVHIQQMLDDSFLFTVLEPFHYDEETIDALRIGDSVETDYGTAVVTDISNWDGANEYRLDDGGFIGWSSRWQMWMLFAPSDMGIMVESDEYELPIQPDLMIQDQMYAVMNGENPKEWTPQQIRERYGLELDRYYFFITIENDVITDAVNGYVPVI